LGGAARGLAGERRGIGLVSLVNIGPVRIPYFAFRVLDEALREGRLPRMFLVERKPMERR
jgi:hypothetical protein